MPSWLLALLLLLSSPLQFTRASYTDAGLYPGYKDWQTDYPKGDRQFNILFAKLTGMKAAEPQAISLVDPNLRLHPAIYAVEVGQMALTQAEVAGLRDYLRAGGFLMVDDFWGSAEWASFERQMEKVMPEYSFVPIPLSHPIFHSFFSIDEIVQVPNSGQAMGGPTWEADGRHPAVLGLFDDQGNLMVMANWNTDLGDGWEWAESPFYPLKYSTYAARLGVNALIYSATH